MAAPFWTRVDSSGGPNACWPWRGARFHFGHGAVWVGKPDRAHRLAWSLVRGPIPAGACVLHRCDNPPCCNPSHLFLGTKADNSRDRDEKGRTARGQHHGRYTRPERTASGERNGRAKIAASVVAEIKKQRATGVTLAALAAQFGIGTSQVRRISLGESWNGN